MVVEKPHGDKLRTGEKKKFVESSGEWEEFSCSVEYLSILSAYETP